ncbi:hypothetical protein DESPIGER_1936 [Desulfovibrio piger]|uniref:Uncharacterized protein n=1 Tax=Desulfovibrio piger TaxID=901 RepID=A0A1K1LGC2_9BACT|nr:hypothetical protein DESPIGER_1936 [Desulfovibrio piger]
MALKGPFASFPIAKYNDFLLPRSHAVAEKAIFTPEDASFFSIW